MFLVWCSWVCCAVLLAVWPRVQDASDRSLLQDQPQALRPGPGSRSCVNVAKPGSVFSACIWLERKFMFITRFSSEWLPVERTVGWLRSCVRERCCQKRQAHWFYVAAAVTITCVEFLKWERRKQEKFLSFQKRKYWTTYCLLPLLKWVIWLIYWNNRIETF